MIGSKPWFICLFKQFTTRLVDTSKATTVVDHVYLDGDSLI